MGKNPDLCTATYPDQQRFKIEVEY